MLLEIAKAHFTIVTYGGIGCWGRAKRGYIMPFSSLSALLISSYLLFASNYLRLTHCVKGASCFFAGVLKSMDIDVSCTDVVLAETHRYLV